MVFHDHIGSIEVMTMDPVEDEKEPYRELSGLDNITAPKVWSAYTTDDV